jgi:hypothetical protein
MNFRPAAVAGLSLALLLTVVSAGAAAAKTTRVNRSSSGAVSSSLASYPGISATGRYVVFETSAPNLVAHDTNGDGDVFVRDRLTGKTKRVSLRSNGAQGNSWSGYSAISAGGRFVAFTAAATNLVRNDTNGFQDVFVHDRQTHVTRRVSVSSAGAQGNLDSNYAAISADGRFIAFLSAASNLVPGDTNGVEDVFVRDMKLRKTTRVTVSSAGVQGDAAATYVPPGSISNDGRFVVFESSATNLVPDDTNAMTDVFVRDRKLKTTRRVSLGPAAAQADSASGAPTISGNGRIVVFYSQATNLVPGDTNGTLDIFTRDRGTNTTRRVSVGSGGAQANGFSGDPYASANGRWVAFNSIASNLVPGDTNGVSDVFVRDRKLGKTKRVSVSSSRGQGNGHSPSGIISGDGRFVVFESYATNLVQGDANALKDIFVRGPLG